MDQAVLKQKGTDEPSLSQRLGLMAPKLPLEKITPQRPGSKQDVFSLPEGDVTLQWPERLSQESYEDVEAWTKLILRKIKRSIDAGEQPQNDEAPE